MFFISLPPKMTAYWRFFHFVPALSLQTYNPAMLPSCKKQVLILFHAVTSINSRNQSLF
ncbi:hypothetical protein HMPREF1545_01475 [Oscillibacter sp. KLE 1728]|nr:hypothetical protein HMPREF1545_01475 [Oscillibacter sp. KLE 1728]